MDANVIARKLNLLWEKAAMRSVDIANLLGARPERVSRWNQGKAFPRSDTQRTLLDLEYIVEQLADFYEPQEARLSSRRTLVRRGTQALEAGSWQNESAPAVEGM